MIAVIDCCGSNFASIYYAFKRLDQEVVLTHDESIIQNAKAVILPGVGHAQSAMQSLKQYQLDTLIPGLRQPVLGICLGMQLMYEYSEEGGAACLGIVKGEVKAFGDRQGFAVPHMGWNQLEFYPSVMDHYLLKGVGRIDSVYFVHSYCAPVTHNTVMFCDYISPFSAMIQKDNFFGMQFHPEKSSIVGEQMLRNFIEIVDLK